MSKQEELAMAQRNRESRELKAKIAALFQAKAQSADDNFPITAWGVCVNLGLTGAGRLDEIEQHLSDLSKTGLIKVIHYQHTPVSHYCANREEYTALVEIPDMLAEHRKEVEKLQAQVEKYANMNLKLAQENVDLRAIMRNVVDNLPETDESNNHLTGRNIWSAYIARQMLEKALQKPSAPALVQDVPQSNAEQAKLWLDMPISQLPQGLRDKMNGQSLSGDSFIDLAMEYLEGETK